MTTVSTSVIGDSAPDGDLFIGCDWVLVRTDTYEGSETCPRHGCHRLLDIRGRYRCESCMGCSPLRHALGVSRRKPLWEPIRKTDHLHWYKLPADTTGLHEVLSPAEGSKLGMVRPNAGALFGLHTFPRSDRSRRPLQTSDVLALTA